LQVQERERCDLRPVWLRLALRSHIKPDLFVCIELGAGGEAARASLIIGLSSFVFASLTVQCGIGQHPCDIANAEGGDDDRLGVLTAGVMRW
jgi:hypothetical protein